MRSRSGQRVPAVSNMQGETALPRSNGELVFEEPWQGRIFGLAVALHDRQAFPWEAFRRRLAGELAGSGAGGDASAYYTRWLASLEALLTEQSLVSKEELEARTQEYAAGLHPDHD